MYKKIIPIKYDEIIAQPELDVFIVKKDNKYGTVRANLEVEIKTVPIEYDSVTPVTRGYIVEKNKKYGVYHTKIGKLEDTKYDEITIENDTLLQCKINGNVVKTVDMNEKSLSEKYYDSAFVKSGGKVIDMIFLWWVPGMAST